MPSWKRTTFAFLAGFVVCAAGVAAKWTFGKNGTGPTGPVPWNREGVAILGWMLDNHPEAPHLTFMAWWPPVRVEDNPFTHEPATLVRVVVRDTRRAATDPVEDLTFYLKGQSVLGYVPSRPTPLEQGPGGMVATAM
jgi:hypothetical protein